MQNHASTNLRNSFIGSYCSVSYTCIIVARLSITIHSFHGNLVLNNHLVPKEANQPHQEFQTQ